MNRIPHPTTAAAAATTTPSAALILQNPVENSQMELKLTAEIDQMPPRGPYHRREGVDVEPDTGFEPRPHLVSKPRSGPSKFHRREKRRGRGEEKEKKGEKGEKKGRVKDDGDAY